MAATATWIILFSYGRGFDLEHVGPWLMLVAALTTAVLLLVDGRAWGFIRARFTRLGGR